MPMDRYNRRRLPGRRVDEAVQEPFNKGQDVPDAVFFPPPVNSAEVDHHGRGADHHRRPNQASDGQLAAGEDVLHRAHRRLHRGSDAFVLRAESLAAYSDFDRSAVERKARASRTAPHAAAVFEERALVAGARLEAGGKAIAFARLERRFLATRAAHGARLAVLIEEPFVLLPSHLLGAARPAAHAGGTVLHVMVLTGLFRHRARITAIGRHGFYGNLPIGLAFKTSLQQLGIVRRVRRNLHIGDQLDVVLGIARLAQPRHIAAAVLLAALNAVGCLRIVGRLQAVGADLRVPADREGLPSRQLRLPSTAPRVPAR